METTFQTLKIGQHFRWNIRGCEYVKTGTYDYRGTGSNASASYYCRDTRPDGEVIALPIP